MNTQFWKPIKPVPGEKIPNGAMYKVAWAGCKTWCPAMTGGTFRDVDKVLKWRVPVEVVPIDMAVDAVMANAFNGTEKFPQDYWSVEVDGVSELNAQTKEQLRELVTAKLREMAGGE